jgi:HK97 family phage prohead protease
MSFETRFNVSKVEIRAAGTDKKGPVMVGYAARFDVKSGVIAGSFREVVRAGAFKDSLANGADVRFLMNHDPTRLLARTKSGTLRLREDSIGLAFEADLADTALANDAVSMVQRGDLDSMSFAFRMIKDAWSEDTDGIALRELNAVDIRDVSLATYPAYPTGTSVDLRAEDPALVELRTWKEAIKKASSRSEFEKRSRRLRLLGAAMGVAG